MVKRGITVFGGFGDRSNSYRLRLDQFHKIQTTSHHIDADYNGFIPSDGMRQSLQYFHIRYNDFHEQRRLNSM